MAMAHKINLLKDGERENFGVVTSKSPLQSSGFCQADRAGAGERRKWPSSPTTTER